MARKILVSAVITTQGVKYNQLVQCAPDGQLSIRPADAELSETRYINGILFCCCPQQLLEILSTIKGTQTGIYEISTNLLELHHNQLLSPITAENLHIYDLHTSSLLTDIRWS